MADRPSEPEAVRARVKVYYSLQSDYCYFLLDRLLTLSKQGVTVDIKPILGGLIRAPERFKDRDELERTYFKTDTTRTAAYLGLPYAYPDPSPIAMKPGSVWMAEDEQPLNERLNRLFVGACEAGRALPFLDHVARMIWDGSTKAWHEGDHLRGAMARAGMSADSVLAGMSWPEAKATLDRHGQDILADGHWGVPLMVCNEQPFYGQDRFDQLIWYLEQEGAAS